MKLHSDRPHQIEKTVKDNQIEIIIRDLPVWENVLKCPGTVKCADLILGWDKKGFLIQRTPAEVLDKIHKAYAQDKYHFITVPPGSSSWSNRLGDEYVDFIETTVDLEKKSVFEIGAGSLYIANKLLQENDIFNYVVVDPAIRESSEDMRLHVIREYFSRDLINGNEVDLIISLNVLEHVPDPARFLVDIKDILKHSNGKAVIILPDTEQQLKRGDFNVILHEHISYFSKKSAMKLAENCGLEVLSCESASDTLKMLVQASGHREEMSQCTILPDDLLMQAADTFQQNLDNIFEYLTGAGSEKKVAFHGANNGLNNMLALSHMDNMNNIFIFDSDEAKTGRYLPACRNPILSSKDPCYASADEVFVAAMSYYAEIRQFLIKYHGIDENRIHPLYPFTRRER